MARNATLAAIQPLRRDDPPMTVEENLQQAIDLLERVPDGTDAVCYPEAFSVASIEAEKTRPSAENVALTPMFLERIAEVAARKGVYVLANLPEQRRNTTFLIDRTGQVIDRYYKVHLTEGEAGKGVIPGDAFPVFELDFARVGVMVCYDLFFPEHCRILALEGAEVIFFPHRITGPSEEGWEALVKARAIENTVCVVSSSFAPPPPYQPGDYLGRSSVVDVNGVVLADASHEPGVAVCTVDLDAATAARPRCFLPEVFLKTRRPGSYGRLCR